MPDLPGDLSEVLKAMDRRLRATEGRAQIRPAMDQILAGSVVVGEGGRLFVQTPDGVTMLYVGDIDPPHPDASRQTGLVVRREDGTAAMSVWDGAGGDQAVILWDRGGRVIVSEDRATGQGLSRPFIGGPGWFGATEQPEFTTDSTAWTTLMITPWVKQQPKLWAWYLIQCSDATTSGEVQLTDNAGTAISPVITAGAGAFFYGSTTGPLAGAHESSTYLRWKARVDPGSTGTIGVKGLAVYGTTS
ncbi:hypothetical protein ACFC26_16250 [Kitasatospora purpeofusca]|uniref:hypothetical protein n=1 Tax=Kitasatospora purpeofusca TaxID=67352 RepID=UPI0035E256A4